MVEGAADFCCLHSSGESRHALDFRLMKSHRVAILDGSHSLFRSGGVFTLGVTSEGTLSSGTQNGSSGAITTGSPGKKGQAGKLVLQQNTTSLSRHATRDEEGGLGLQAIPRFREIVGETVAEVRGSRVVGVEVGVICDVNSVRAVTRGLHSRVIKQLSG